MGSFKDLTGQTFGVLQVLERDTTPRDGKPRVYYKVKCLNCGNEYSVRADGLKRNPDHCIKCKYLNLVGKTYNSLTVIAPTFRVDAVGHKYWLCKCNECGNTKEILGTHLVESKQITCGCKQYELIATAERDDITGQKFGKLTAIEYDKIKSYKNHTCWICQCECGNYCSVYLGNLKNGHTTSCGCIHSIGEYKIRQILLKEKIQFVTEYSFKDLPQRRFDFAIFKNQQLYCLIEYDGKQHFEYVNTWHKTEENFLAAITRDEEKNEYCRKNNIKLYRIRYDESLEKRVQEIITEINS